MNPDTPEVLYRTARTAYETRVAHLLVERGARGAPAASLRLRTAALLRALADRLEPLASRPTGMPVGRQG